MSGIKTCDSPAGINMTESSAYTPCNAAATNSHCCVKEDMCLNNGYCFSQGNYFALRIYRGGCTDKSFGSSCPQRCTDVNPGGSTSIGLVHDKADGLFCCAYGDPFTNGSSCLDTTNGTAAPFDLPPALVIYNRATGAVIDNTENGPSAANTSLPTASKINKAAIGIGVGLALPLAIACGFLLLLLVRQKRKQRLTAAESPRSLSAARHAGVIGQPVEPPRSSEVDHPQRQAFVMPELASSRKPRELDTLKR
ncbi:hypothetical protein ANO11243_050140 [Dothideomycetidae sp. 11243]|nr:hypothetical protein ANO11243_050140 [fungal sp. No.11243]